MQGSNWFAVSREVFEHPIVGVRNRRYCETLAWLDLIRLATYKPTDILNQGRKQHLEPSQLMAAHTFLAKRWRWTVAQVRAYLKRLEKSEMLRRENREKSDNQCQVITLCNYGKFQILADGEQQAHDKRTTSARQQVNNKQETNTSPNGEEATRAEITVVEAYHSYNALALKLGLPQATTLTAARKRQLLARLKEHGADSWERALANLEASPFLRGENDRGWRASLDFILQASSYTKLLDGAYGGTHLTRLHAAKAVGTRVRDTSESIGDYTARMIREGKFTPPGVK